MNLDYDDLIYISAHGFYDDKNNTSIIWTQEKASKQTERNKEYKKLKKNGDIGIYKNAQGESYYVVMPSFFQDYYVDNELKDSIVLLGVCEAFGKDNNENYDFYNIRKFQ